MPGRQSLPKEMQMIPQNPIVQPVQPKFNVLEPPGALKRNVTINTTLRAIIADNIPEPVKPVVQKPEVVASVTEKTVKPKVMDHVVKAKSNQPIVETTTKKSTQNLSKDIEAEHNKTMENLGVMGNEASEKRLPKVLFEKLKWNLSASFEDIGNLMKDTSFLNKLKPLNLSGPMLTSTRNRTANFSMSMPVKMGYCDCWEHYCVCCVQIVNKQLHLNVKACSNFTFISKSHVSIATYFF